MGVGCWGMAVLQESVIWGQTFWPGNGTLRAAYMHAHMQRLDEIWVFAAPAAHLGLNSDPLRIASLDPKTLYLPSKYNMSNAEAKKLMMANFAASVNRRCGAAFRYITSACKCPTLHMSAKAVPNHVRAQTRATRVSSRYPAN